MSADNMEKQERDIDTPEATNPDVPEEQEGGPAGAQEDSAPDSDGQSKAAEAPVDEVTQLQARVGELEAEVSELKDLYLRKQADFENFRKRMQRERQTAAEFANKQLLLDIVTIIDDFERAIKSAEESKDFDAFHSGVLLIEKQFTSMLERKWGLRRFDSVGEEFDPQKHEAVATEDSPEYETSVVLEDYQKGYYLHDKVLRSAKVKVSMPVADDAGGDNSE